MQALTGDPFSIDAPDAKIIDLMMAGDSNQKISKKLGKPLSTVQRRTRALLQNGILTSTLQLDYRKFGYKVGLLHIYLNDGETRLIAEKIAEMPDVKEVSIHIGNSDIIADYACKGTAGLLDLLAKIKAVQGVNRIVWSEEVYLLPPLRKAVVIPFESKKT